MNVFISLAAVVFLFLAGLLGAGAGLDALFGIVIPYIAIFLFLGGLIYRVMIWANVPVPFRIPTTSGQEKSLPWIKQSKLDNPSSTLGVIGRMALEILCFRSLLKNTKTELHEDGHVAYGSSLWLWLGSMAFHWSMLIILLRHIRLFIEPVPGAITFLHKLDGFLQIGAPVFYVTSFIFPIALLYLLFRRLGDPKLRYISLVNDYFPLFLLIGVGISGFWLRYISKTDIASVKELTVGLMSFRPVTPAAISPLFYGHLFLVCVLLGYFPFSKLVHMAGVFFSPTRNLANTNREAHHANPWDYPVKVHTYEEYEDEFREKMKAVGIPVEKE
ncbi:MAG: menaquinol oxidoreductase [Candidatus Latescibacteria bacterium]|nr:menaquinol oxidoreductase [Candidatus Latescibacterota bacterium]NIO55234.1 menaquinol oxidoreductase [Candidatus Latescibacterota bacterium]